MAHIGHVRTINQDIFVLLHQIFAFRTRKHILFKAGVVSMSHVVGVAKRNDLCSPVSPYSTLFARLAWSRCLVWWVWQKVALPCIVVVARGILSCTSCVLCAVLRSLLCYFSDTAANSKICPSV